jgi:hypothetical protein
MISQRRLSINDGPADAESTAPADTDRFLALRPRSPSTRPDTADFKRRETPCSTTNGDAEFGIRAENSHFFPNDLCISMPRRTQLPLLKTLIERMDGGAKQTN